MKPANVFLFFFLLLSVSCRSDYSRKQQEIRQLMACCTDTDTLADLPRALYLTDYMEANGKPADRQRAWRMLAKVYRQHRKPAFEMRALRIALASVDTCHAYDTLEMAKCYYDMSTCLHNCSRFHEALTMSLRACQLAEAVHDTIQSHIWMGQRAWTYSELRETSLLLQASDSAYRYLWAHGMRTEAVDARLPYVSHQIGICPTDSAMRWLEEYRRLTHRNLTSPHSRDAIFFWRLQGNCWKHRGQTDSAAAYYRRMLQPGSPNNEAMVVGYSCLARLYEKAGNDDTANVYYTKARESHEEGKSFNFADSMEEEMDGYHRKREYMEKERRARHTSHMLIASLTAIGFLAVFGIYRYAFLRRRYNEVLMLNSEHAEMLELLKQKSLPQLVTTTIARRFHELSSQEAHPTSAEWQALYTQTSTLYPHLFPTLVRNYGLQFPGQTLSGQEQRAVCLIAIRCTPLQMSILMVCSKSNVSNLRRRLYHKLTGKEGTGADLDRLIAELCS